MKKLLFVFTLLFSVSFMSCGEQTKSSVASDSTMIDSTDTVADTIAVDTTVADSAASLSVDELAAF